MIGMKWKLGWRVLGRTLLFAFALSIVGFLLRLCLMIAATSDAMLPETIGKPVAIALALIVLILILPLGMYWAASWTGYLQGSDRKKFGELRSEQSA